MAPEPNPTADSSGKKPRTRRASVEVMDTPAPSAGGSNGKKGRVRRSSVEQVCPSTMPPRARCSRYTYICHSQTWVVVFSPPMHLDRKQLQQLNRSTAHLGSLCGCCVAEG